jgi:eukaryotic-like serine/threonine-protein kinase
MSSANPAAYPSPGAILDDKYEIQEVLGTGAMGAVLRAQHLLRKAPVALKFVSPDIVEKRGVVDRFLNEAVAASKIDSEHVVKVFDVSKLPNGTPYMVMEFLEGEDLAHLMRRHGQGLEEVPRAIHMALQILRGLSVAHAANIVHRDMKPANCFVTGKDGDSDFIKIVDFGISKLREEGGLELTQAGSALGTPLYMSPEQARNPKDVDARSDLYAVAAILYELLSGKPPFVPASGMISELFVMLGTEDPKSLEEIRHDLPPGLWDAIEKGLQKKPEHRFQSSSEMAEALAPFADERSDYIVAKMQRSSAVGITRRSFRPPPSAIECGETLAMEGKAQPAIEPTVESGPAAIASKATAVPAETAQGTVADAPASQRKSTPLVWAIAVVAVAATAVAAWALSQAAAGGSAASDGPVEAPSATISVRAPDPSEAPVPSDPPAPRDTASPVSPEVPPAPSVAPTLAPPDIPPVGVPLPGPQKLKELGRD